MIEDAFQDCLEHWKDSDGFTKFWPDLAIKWNYKDGESIRQEFKNERKRRGIKKENGEVKKVVEKSPRILLFDIETSQIGRAHV
mgnify:FL=1